MQFLGEYSIFEVFVSFKWSAWYKFTESLHILKSKTRHILHSILCEQIRVQLEYILLKEVSSNLRVQVRFFSHQLSREGEKLLLLLMLLKDSKPNHSYEKV